MTFVSLLSLPPGFSQTSYKSETDKNLNVSSLSLLSVLDNVNGIYAKPIREQLKKLIQKNHHWRYIEEHPKPLFPFSAYTVQNNNLPKNSLQSILSSLKAEASIVIAILKGQTKLSLTLNLFLKSDQKLLLQEKVKDLKHFNLRNVQEEIEKSFQRLMSKLPYRGLILSRQGDSITLSLGKKDGVKAYQVFSVIQILKLFRHPKFDFLIQSQNQTLGQVEIIKVDNTLSFGRIKMEKEHGVIQKNAKIAKLR